MITLIVKALILCLLVFWLFAWLGWKLNSLGRAKWKDSYEAPLEKIPLPISKPSLDVEAAPLYKATQLAEMTPDQLEAAVNSVVTPIEPLRLKAAKGKIDDLKIIIGIGPVNEKELNDLGIYHFWQIAEWDAQNIAWVSEHIRFSNRIVRENWIKQASDLAKNKND
jgi:predicted flap endonuclease-1-like 5' DNA nuclease